jgi:hypothetical protein
MDTESSSSVEVSNAIPNSVLDEEVTERVELPQPEPTPLQAAFWSLGLSGS